VVLLHEGLGCVSTWRDFPDALATALDRPVFAYSRAGYGRSDPVELPRPSTYMHHEGKVLPRVLDAAGIREALLIGHSDGGSIAIVAAGLGDPRIVGLVLVAAHVFTEPPCLGTIRDAGRRFRESDLRGRLERHHGRNVDCAFLGWHDVWLSPEFLGWNLEGYLPGITVPTLVLQGEDDTFGTTKQVEAIVRGVGGPVEARLIPDCGHRAHRDQPVALLEAIVGFVETVEGGGT